MNRLTVVCLFAAVTGCSRDPSSGAYNVSFAVVLDECALRDGQPFEPETWDITFSEERDVTVETSDEVPPQCALVDEVVECSRQLEADGLSYQQDFQLSWDGQDSFVGNADVFVTCVDDCGKLDDVLPCSIVVSVLGSLPGA